MVKRQQIVSNGIFDDKQGIVIVAIEHIVNLRHWAFTDIQFPHLIFTIIDICWYLLTLLYNVCLI